MASLSSRGRALVRAGRRVVRPTPADRDRIEEALRARLGLEALPSPVNATPPVRGGSSLLAKAVVTTCLVGGALLAVLPRLATPPSAPREAAAARSEPVELAASAGREAARIQAATEPPASAPVAPVAATPSAGRRAPDPLAQEVRLLSQATNALRAGRAAAALRVLDVHQRRFPAGALTEERRAAKAQALCLLGRISEGRSELSRLPPNSPSAARGAQVCQTEER